LDVLSVALDGRRVDPIRLLGPVRRPVDLVRCSWESGLPKRARVRSARNPMARSHCRSPRVLTFLVFELLAVATACRGRPVAGDACRRAGALLCPANDRGLLCDGGSYEEIACRGPLGCSADRGQCDTSVGKLNDPCPGGARTFACTEDRMSALACEAGRFERWRECRGPRHCSATNETGVECDTSFGETGDPCAQTDVEACSVDRSALLRCNGKSFEVASMCRGSDGCTIDRQNHSVMCDDRSAVDRDPCDRPKRVACSLDGGAELVCESGKYRAKRSCRYTSCSVDGDRVVCE